MPIRLIQVGMGVRGRHWLEIVRDYPDAIPVAYVDPDSGALASARKLAGATEARFFTDLDHAVRDVPADAALIVSPSRFHAEHATRALHHGLHVMVEKPFATSVKDAETVIEAADTVKKQVMVAENYRFFPAERTMGRWIREARLGRIATVTCVDRRDQPPSDLGSWASSMPYPQLVEIAVHHFDSFRYLLGRRPVTVMARSFNPPGSRYESGAATSALFEMEEGLTVMYSGSLCSHRYEYALWIEGEAGSLWTDRKRVWWRARGRRFFFPTRLDPVAGRDGSRYPRAGTTALLNQFRDAVRGSAVPETSGRDNIWTIAMVEAAIRSAQEGHAVAIAEADGRPYRNNGT
jgi:predicted dehydrogenase